MYYNCDVFVFYSIKNGREKFEFSTVIFHNDMCDIEIKRSFKSNYLIKILNNEKLENIGDFDISIIKNKYTKLNGIDSLSTTNIKEHIDYINSYYNEVLEINNKNKINIKKFLDSIKNEQVEWYDDYKSGLISKKWFSLYF